MELIYDEIVGILDMKVFAGSSNGWTLPTLFCEIIDLNLILKALLRNEVKVNITIADIKLRSNLTIRQRSLPKISFLNKIRFYLIILSSFERSSERIHSINTRHFKVH